MGGGSVMEPHAIITPLKAIRMLLNGTGTLVRTERWAEVHQEVTYWKGMYQQAHEQRSIWYERCQAAERRLAELGEAAWPMPQN